MSKFVGRLGMSTRRSCLWNHTLEHINEHVAEGDVFLILGDYQERNRPYFPVLVKGKIGWLLDSDGLKYL